MDTASKQPFFFCILIFLTAFFPLMAQTSAVTSEGYLRDWQYDGDHIAYSTENGIVRSVMTADDEKLILRKYDDRHRMVSETVWNDGYELITSETTWDYTEKKVFPEMMTKRLWGQKQVVKVLYTESGFESARSVFQMEDGEEGNLLEKTEWQYDEENRVICILHENNVPAEPADGSEPVRNDKTVYTYTDKSSEPDSSYYENGMLVEKTVYLSESTWIQSLFFDDMEIKATWVDGLKTEEVYYMDGKEVKRKTL